MNIEVPLQQHAGGGDFKNHGPRVGSDVWILSPSTYLLQICLTSSMVVSTVLRPMWVTRLWRRSSSTVSSPIVHEEVGLCSLCSLNPRSVQIIWLDTLFNKTIECTTFEANHVWTRNMKPNAESDSDLAEHGNHASVSAVQGFMTIQYVF